MSSARGIQSWLTVVATALAIALVFAAVQSHASPDLCARSAELVDAHHHNPHPESNHQDEDQGDCCLSACVLCVAPIRGTGTILKTVAPTIALLWRSSRLSGQAPSPGWHPPRSAG